MIDVERAGIGDLWQAMALERACFGPDAWGPLELIVELLSPTVRLKALQRNDAGNRLVGLAIGERRGRIGWIATLGVHPDFQRQGIGRQLLAAAEMALNTPILKLTVRASNRAAINLYEQFGYRTVNRLARYYANGEDGLVMEKVTKI